MTQETTQDLASALVKQGVLPDPKGRMMPSQKEAILNAILHGHISSDNVCIFYRMSEEELENMSRGYRQHGRHGLKITTLSERRLDEICQLRLKAA